MVRIISLLLLFFAYQFSGNAQYCIPTYTNPDGDDFIDGFELSNLTNNNTGYCGGDGNIDYTQSLPAIELTIGQQYDFNYTGGIYDSDKYRVWIDYNHDNDFDDANEAIANGTTSLSYQTILLQFIVSPGAQTGLTRLRIRCAYALVPLIDPCANYNYGETEDYAVNISPSTVYCTPDDQGLNGTVGLLASGLSFGSISSSFYFPSEPYYHNYTSTLSTSGTVGGSIDGQFEFGSIVGATLMMWIDWNQDAAFSLSEFVHSVTNNSLFEMDNFTVDVPNSALTGSTRIRVRIQVNGVGMDPCFSSGNGFAEDYTLNISGSVGTAPTAAFSANPLTVAVGGSVDFTDLSAGDPTSWTWNFTGASPSSSGVQNPAGIIYNTPGCYAVSLSCSNDDGSDVLSEPCYINVVEQGEGCSELFFSEYIEGAGNDKAIEIYNPNSSAIDLSAYSIELYPNGAVTPNTTFDFTGSLAAHAALVIASSTASANILSLADETSGVCNFNGNDALTLSKNGIAIDAIGEVGSNPGSFWSVGTGSTSDHTLVRKPNVSAPSLNWTEGQNEWLSFSSGTISNLGIHDSDCDGGTSVTNELKTFEDDPIVWMSNYGGQLNWKNVSQDLIGEYARIFDSKGVIVDQFRMNADSSSISMQPLADGIYLLMVAGSGPNVFVKKLVVCSGY